MFASLKQNLKKFLSKAMSLKKSSTTQSTKIGMVTIGNKNEFLGCQKQYVGKQHKQIFQTTKKCTRARLQGECNLQSLKNLRVLIYSKLHEKNHGGHMHLDITIATGPSTNKSVHYIQLKSSYAAILFVALSLCKTAGRWTKIVCMPYIKTRL